MENLISKVTTLLVSMSDVQQKVTRHIKKQESMTHSKGRNKSTETVLEKDLMAYILYKDFKTTVLKMLKELTEDVKKVKKTM